MLWWWIDLRDGGCEDRGVVGMRFSVRDLRDAMSGGGHGALIGACSGCLRA